MLLEIAKKFIAKDQPGGEIREYLRLLNQTPQR